MTDYGLTKVSYSVPETAELLHVCRRTVERYVREGTIRPAKIGKRRTVFLRPEIERFLTEAASRGESMGAGRDRAKD